MSALTEARDAIASLESFAAQVEDEERSGDLGQLLAADAIALAVLALIEALAGARP